MKIKRTVMQPLGKHMMAHIEETADRKVKVSLQMDEEAVPTAYRSILLQLVADVYLIADEITRVNGESEKKFRSRLNAMMHDEGMLEKVLRVGARATALQN